METLPGGSARNDDVQMRLSSTYVDLDDCYIDQEPIVIPLEKRDWNLSIYSPPEAPKRVANKDKVSMANFRSVLTARVQGDCLHHMETLRFK